MKSNQKPPPPQSTSTDSADIPVANKAKPSSDEFVDLVVGGYPYKTTRSVLSSSPYFEALLSGRWERKEPLEPIDIPDMDGRLFFYVLYYLQLGQIPRNPDTSVCHSLLSKEDIDGLQMQGDFFGLTGLVNLCKEDVPKRVKGTGDLDLTDFSNVSVEIARNQSRPQFHCTILYQYKNETWVFAKIEENIFGDMKRLSIELISDGKTILNTPGADDIVDRLRKVFWEEIESDGRMSVTRILDQGLGWRGKAPEARLWFALIVNSMIEFHKINWSWDLMCTFRWMTSVK